MGRDTSPVRPTPSLHLHPRIKLVINELKRLFPTITIEVGHEAIEDPTSPFFKIRNKTLLTASNAGVLWNCKRTTTLKEFLEVSLGKKEPRPFTEFALQLMKAGRDAEPFIMTHFTQAIASELFRTIPGVLFYSLQPGPVQHEHSHPWGLYYTSATADGLWIIGVPTAYTDETRTKPTDYKMLAITYEVKFFASKSEMPETLPSDYSAQVLMQMIHYGHTVGLLIGAIKVNDEFQYRVWLLKIEIEGQNSHVRTYFTRLFQLAEQIDKAEIPSQTRKANFEIDDLVVKHTDNLLEIISFVLKNEDCLLRVVDGQLTPASMGSWCPSTFCSK